jgi:hypothetical protein
MLEKQARAQGCSCSVGRQASQGELPSHLRLFNRHWTHVSLFFLRRPALARPTILRGPLRRAPRGGETKSADAIDPPWPSSWTICSGLGRPWSVEPGFLVLRFLTAPEFCIARGADRPARWPAVDEALDREGMVETIDSGTSLTMNAVVFGAGCDPSRELG